MQIKGTKTWWYQWKESGPPQHVPGAKLTRKWLSKTHEKREVIFNVREGTEKGMAMD